MAKSFTFQVITPRGIRFKNQVQLAVIPGGTGDLAVLPGHAPLVSSTRKGEFLLQLAAQGEERFVAEGGFLVVGAEISTLYTPSCT